MERMGSVEWRWSFALRRKGPENREKRGKLRPIVVWISMQIDGS